MPGKGLRSRLLSALPRAMHVYWRFARGLTMGVRAVVIGRDGRIFLVKHSYAEGWHLPGGGVEAGETLLDALARELSEEGNIEIIGTPLLHGIYFHPHFSNRDHIAVYVVREFRQPSMPVRNREIIEHGFFSPDALPPDTTQGTRARIGEVLRGIPSTMQW